MARYILLLSTMFLCFPLWSQTAISGKIVTDNNEPVIGANVYILGSIDGGSSNTEGEFSFTTLQSGELTLVVSSIGFKEFRINKSDHEFENIVIHLSKDDVNINEVVIVASNFNLGQNRTIKKMNALDVVLTGSSNGDIYAAVQALPGTQKVGEDGKLYIRGGESRETQTFIDGMHVLMPYSTTASNMPSRGRFSPFLFKGINFSLGGYDPEYGQALSSVLPMDTKDVSSGDKLGLSFSPLSAGAGGTKSWKKSSLSFSADFMDLSLYNKTLPDKYIWVDPYSKISAEGQFKIELNPRSTLKIYAGYDNTSFTRLMSESIINKNVRNLGLIENNTFVNATYNTLIKNKFSLFLGCAISQVNKQVNNALVNTDSFLEDDKEVHFKAKFKRIFSDTYKLNFGIEGYVKNYSNNYNLQSSSIANNESFKYKIGAAFIDNQFKIAKGLYANVSSRIEYTDYNKDFSFTPRLSMSYLVNQFQLSGIYGKYFQAPEYDILTAYGANVKQENATHYIFSGSYNFDGRLFKTELYYKEYKNLTLIRNNEYSDKGYGYSQGIDLYFSDETTVDRLKYSVYYSYNDTKRMYRNYPVLTQPQFSTMHNASASLRYFFPAVKTFLSITNRFASGRPYSDPNSDGFLNLRTIPYTSFDMNVTFLLRKDIILYASVTNVFNRENIFNYNYSTTPDADNIFQRIPVTASRDRFFYFGLFISLKNDTAYDVSNF